MSKVTTTNNSCIEVKPSHLVIETQTDKEAMYEDFFKLHPKNYTLNEDGSVCVDVKCNLKFDLEKDQFIIDVWQEN